MINDDSIIDDGFVVRDTLTYSGEAFSWILDMLKNANLEVSQESQIREYCLNIITRIYNYSPKLIKNKAEEILEHHKAAINEAFTKLPNRVE